VHLHDLADEGRGRVEAAPAPLSARRAALEAAWPPFRSGPGQAPDLVGRRLAPALGQVAEDVLALAAVRQDERVESALTRLELGLSDFYRPGPIHFFLPTGNLATRQVLS